jgi:TonB family protein
MHQSGMRRSRTLVARPPLWPQRRLGILPVVRQNVAGGTAADWPASAHEAALARRAPTSSSASTLDWPLRHEPTMLVKLDRAAILLRSFALLFLFLSPTTKLAAQTSAAGSYRDSSSGLEKLTKDIMRAQKENSGALAQKLLDGLVLPDYQNWYRENFDEGAVDLTLPIYERGAKTLPTELAAFFLRAQQEGFTDIQAVRFDRECDDNASEQTFNTLDARRKDVPLYELRFLHGSQFRRLFAFVFVDGGFRFIVTPDFSPTSAGFPKPKNSTGQNTGAGKTVEAGARIRQGGAVQAAHLTRRVQPIYPEIAKQERLSGTVRLHALIGLDGSVRVLRVLSGRCSFARASVDAVRQWRYRPTTIDGNPVEVDTTIDVIFALNR